jgi:hypothetical protein
MQSMTNHLSELESWYRKQCDGDWEHEFGIKIENLDNPGWNLVVPLRGTNLEQKPFSTLDINRTETDWIYCKKADGYFDGCGGTHNLEELIAVFLSFAKSS